MDKDIWIEYDKTKSSELRNKILLSYVHLVKIIVLRLITGTGQNKEIDDLIGYGILGLIDAIEKYDYKKGVKFETYASYRIRGSIIDQLRKQDWVPRNVREKSKLVMNQYEKLEGKLGRTPSEEEVAESLNMSLQDLQKTIDKFHTFNIISLDEQLYESANVYDDTLMDKSSLPENSIEEKELIDQLSNLIDGLTEKERLVVTLYYYEELTFREIGEVMGVSESRISQLHSKSIMKIKNGMLERGLMLA